MNTLKYDIIVSKAGLRYQGRRVLRQDRRLCDQDRQKRKGRLHHPQRGHLRTEHQGQQDNMIIADSGKMVVTPDKQSLVFTLKNGSRYQEKAEAVAIGTELIRMGFSTYKKVMDLSSFKMNKTNDSTFKGNYQMLVHPPADPGHRFPEEGQRNQRSPPRKSRQCSFEVPELARHYRLGQSREGHRLVPIPAVAEIRHRQHPTHLGNSLPPA